MQTNDPNDVGYFLLIITASLANYPLFASQDFYFLVDISCEVQKLTFSTAPPASTTLQLRIDIQPFNIAYAII